MAEPVRVIALGGSILAPDGPDADYAARFVNAIGERLAHGERVAVVTGGGRPARRYIDAARPLGVGEQALDEVGIAATRLNATFLHALLVARLGATVAPGVAHTVEETARKLVSCRVAVMGGTVPGHSTDFVAARLATVAGAQDLLVLTNVDGVYTADPRADPRAERLPTLSTARLLQIVGGGWHAGRTGVVDPSCAAHAHEARLPLVVLDGRSIEAVRAALAGDPSAGSRVEPGD